jgi:hypothetical protein
MTGSFTHPVSAVVSENRLPFSLVHEYCPDLCLSAEIIPTFWVIFENHPIFAVISEKYHLFVLVHQKRLYLWPLAKILTQFW